jgi:hypothetical protein
MVPQSWSLTAPLLCRLLLCRLLCHLLLCRPLLCRLLLCRLLLCRPLLCRLLLCRLLQLLAGCCDLLGGWLQLSMECRAVPPGGSWCREAYVVAVENVPQPGRRQQQQRQQLGKIVVLIDEAYRGLPATQVAR